MQTSNSQSYIKILSIALLVETTIIIFGAIYFVYSSSKNDVVLAKQGGEHFYYTFNVSETLPETSSMDKSPSPYWWVNSGGYLSIENGIGKTASGTEPPSSIWRLSYEKNNPVDTDNGQHPQNIFRMVTKSKWRNFEQEAYFNIKTYNLSLSPNRNVSNGLFLFARYYDADNTYYVGLRVDGQAVIKKKINGTYFTLAEKKIWEDKRYDRDNNPIILPQNTWMGVRSEINNLTKDRVMIQMFIDKNKTGVWDLVLKVVDDGSVGGSALTEGGFAGLRTDFADVEFSDYVNKEI